LTCVVIVASSTAPAALLDPVDEVDALLSLLAMPLLEPGEVLALLEPDMPDEPVEPDELMLPVLPVEAGVDDEEADVPGDVLLVDAFLSALRWSQPAAKSTELAANAASSCMRVRVFIRGAPF